MKGRDYLLKIIGSTFAAPSIPKVIIIEPDASGIMQASEGRNIVPDGSIREDDMIIFITPTNADPTGVQSVKKRIFAQQKIC